VCVIVATAVRDGLPVDRRVGAFLILDGCDRRGLRTNRAATASWWRRCLVVAKMRLYVSQ
jgi:hypothetical protein